MKISVIGTGYVGLVTGTCFAEVGIDTTCVDIDNEKIRGQKKGIAPIYEPGLDSMIERNLSKGHLHFSPDIASSIIESEIVFIAVGTPPDEDGSADLKHVLILPRELAEVCRDIC